MKFKQKKAKKDFDYINLPHNRTQVFFDVFKLHWKTILVLSLFILVGFLPVLAPIFFRDYYALGLAASGSYTKEEISALLTIPYILASLCSWVGLYIFSILLSGVLRIVRQLVWGEPLFFKEDFVKGIKANYKGCAIASTLFGLIFLISSFIYTLSQSPIWQAIPVGLFMAFVAPPLLITLMQMTIYEGKFIRLYKNSVLIYIKEAPKVLLFVVILFSPLLLAIWQNNLMIKTIVVLAILFLVVIFLIIIFSLFSFYLFDKYINVTHYPELMKKGMYKEK